MDTRHEETCGPASLSTGGVGQLLTVLSAVFQISFQVSPRGVTPPFSGDWSVIE